MASLTIFLTVCEYDMHLHPSSLHVSICFTSFYYYLQCYVFVPVYVCVCTHYPTCDGQLPSVSSELTVSAAFPLLMVDKGIFLACYLIFIPVKQEVIE